MNIQGLVLTKKMILELHKDIDKISINVLKGINRFHKFSWTGFDKEEFKACLNLFTILEKAACFKYLDDKQEFVVNYTNNVTEMDVATILSHSDGTQLIVDMEYKSGDQAREKLDIQLEKRLRTHLPQLFDGLNSLVILFDEDGFYKAVLKVNYQEFTYNSLEDLALLLIDYTSNYEVLSIFEHVNNLSSIHDIYHSIANRTFSYSSETVRLTNQLTTQLEKNDVVFCTSKPGTGKTVAALKILFENNNATMLIINQKLYEALGMGNLYQTGKCFYGSKKCLQSDLTNKILIIDEFQRLSKNMLLALIEKAEKTILFGDFNQLITDEQQPKNKGEMLSLMQQYNIKYWFKHNLKSKRYDDEVQEVIDDLLDLTRTKNKSQPANYRIKLYFNQNDFINDYNNAQGLKKMFTNYSNKDESFTIKSEVYKVAAFDNYNFSISSSCSSTMGHTLHAISFDVDHSFIYLPTAQIIKYNRRLRFSNKHLTNPTNIELDLFRNELNILFTRGKKSLSIYVEDIHLYLFLNSKLFG